MGRPTPEPVEFAPPEEVRPADGTLIDERANVIDVTARTSTSRDAGTC